MKYSGAEIVIKFLEKFKITEIAGIPGGANLPLYYALSKSKIKHILSRHEQGAGFIAQGMARSTSKPGVCFATSGPGATNLLTALADAKLDSIPIIAITGQVPTTLIGTDAFQEIDICSMAKPITKKTYLARSAKELLEIIPDAFHTCQSGRPGPILIDIPKNVQKEIIEISRWPDYKKINSPPKPAISQIQKAAQMINESQRPIIYAGGGIIRSEASQLLYRFAKKNSIPVATTLMGLGSFPPNDPLYLGMLGMHGAKSVNLALNESDLLLAFGVRFDDRATGKIEEFCPNSKIIHIDIDTSEFNKNKKAHISIKSDMKDALEYLIPITRNAKRITWRSYIEKLNLEYGFNNPESKSLLNPINLIKTLGIISEKNAIISTDVGQHQMWVAQHFPFREPRTLLTSGGLGTMGFGLPAAIGAALSHPKRQIICISGDGSILMNIQELATLADHNLNIKIIILNNGSLGLVRQQQELFYNKNYTGSIFKVSPDFCSIAETFGIRSVNVTSKYEVLEKLKNALNDSRPCLINIPIHFRENVYPITVPGKSNCEMIDENYYEAPFETKVF